MTTTNQLAGTEAQVKSILDKRVKAIYDRDLESILAMYSQDIISFDLKEPLLNKGLEFIKSRLEEWFASYKSAINQELKELIVTSSDSTAFSHCLTRTYGTSSKDEKQDMWYRATTGFSKINGKWLITHEHLSEPIDLQTGKALFDLQP